ncbi:MAG: hypothetical protein KKC79_03360 [Gammaproteobacteria bacterium]|nr:hypothetical protein [Gammaproteobacteria bacterium]MBU1443467.1 hypothetical protein [Gammaproteobacteria bacterium]MBU2288914.1 hypothetical protein [Gammaproteobacteria bacterium]MBU2407668.1 hypothetical protein [Gammaproteobacteria bacterium]
MNTIIRTPCSAAVNRMPRHASSRSQRGAALFMGLVFTLAALLLAIGAVLAGFYQQRIAGSARDRDLAFQAAEAALRDAELSIMCRAYTGATPALSPCAAGGTCMPGCGSGPPSSRFALGFQPATASSCPNGLCTPAPLPPPTTPPTTSEPIWEAVDWSSTSTIPIGTFTRHPDRTTGVVPGISLARQPRFLIEAVPATCDPAVRFCT